MCFIISFFAFITLWLVILTKKTVIDRERNRSWAFRNQLIANKLNQIKKGLDEIS